MLDNCSHFLATFKFKKEKDISTQDINNLGSRFRKKPLRSSKKFKDELRSRKHRKMHLNAKDKRGYKALLTALQNEAFPWPSSRSQSQETGINIFLTESSSERGLVTGVVSLSI